MWLLATVMGCDDYQPGLQGLQTWEMFPFDGERSWDYISTDGAVPYKLIARSSAEAAELIGGTFVYTVTYETECLEDTGDCESGVVLYSLRWSSNTTDGVRIHGYDLGSGAEELDPPLTIALDEMLADESATTEIDGVTWTSTLMGLESCPIFLIADWDDCGHFVVEGDEALPIPGDWWATQGAGVAALELAGAEGQWQLSDFDCEGDCDGEW
jgi:hypothetical protein